jgi:predicted NAD-dependent protein-ADP-ribosyltransferase YbiA (DUF1768 family)
MPELYFTISVSGPLCGLSLQSIAYPFIYNGVRYLSVIQAYYASFLKDKPTILKGTTVALIEKACQPQFYRIIEIHKKRGCYFETKRILYNILRAKFEQNPIAKILLLATKSNWYLRVDCGSDSVIGIGSTGFGLNLSGLVMMELREHLSGRPRTPLLQERYDAVLRRLR